MFVHLVLDDVSEGTLGVGLEIVETAARLVRAGLASAPDATRRLRQRVVSIDGRAVRASTGRTVAVDGALETRAIRADDVVVVPGLSGAASERAIAALLLRRDALRAATLLPRLARRGATVAASCSATFVLASSGLLEGGSATTTWWLASSFARRFPRVAVNADRIVVESGRVLTAGSAFAHADLVLGLLARTTSAELAHQVARYLVLDERASQSRYMAREHLRLSDPMLVALERHVAANLERRLTLPELARAVGTSPRTLARRVAEGVGTTPLRWVQRLKVAQAAHWLETTSASVDDVAARVGYADPAAFRRAFRRWLGESPRGRT